MFLNLNATPPSGLKSPITHLLLLLPLLHAIFIQNPTFVGNNLDRALDNTNGSGKSKVQKFP